MALTTRTAIVGGRRIQVLASCENILHAESRVFAFPKTFLRLVRQAAEFSCHWHCLRASRPTSMRLDKKCSRVCISGKQLATQKKEWASNPPCPTPPQTSQPLFLSRQIGLIWACTNRCRIVNLAKRRLDHGRRRDTGGFRRQHHPIIHTHSDDDNDDGGGGRRCARQSQRLSVSQKKGLGTV